MTWEKLVATIVVALLGWVAARARQRRIERDAARAPALEAARDAEALKARELERDHTRDPDDVGLRVDEAAPSVRRFDPDSLNGTAIGDVLDRVWSDRLRRGRD